MDFLADFAGLRETVVDKISSWVEGLYRMLPNLAMAILVVWAAWLVAGGAARFVGRQMERISEQKQLRRLVVAVVRLGTIVAGLVVALGILDLQKTVASILAGVGILGLALGFAFQDIAANFMAGILLIVRKPFHTGDLVEVGDFTGRVERINMRDTVGRTPQGQQVIIPNRQVLGNPITNYSANEVRRVDLVCGVAYGDDLDKAEAVAVRAVEGIDGRVTERPVEFFYEEFGGSSINFKIRFWVPAEQKAFLAGRSRAIKAIKTAFDREGITIPFPIRTLDFGVVGGEPLAEHLRVMTEKGKERAEP
jgi:small conductance mechanosensitive channel